MKTPNRLPLILIAEDNLDHAFFLTEALAEVGLTDVVHAMDGLECLNRLGLSQELKGLQQLLPDLLLLDIRMPRMNGLEVMNRIQQASMSLPVVVMSTSAETADVENMRGMGAQAYVRKPSGFEGYLRFAEQLRSWWLQGDPLPNEHL